MPIFEYRCNACGHEFEFLLIPSAPTSATCPACSSQDLEKLLAGFAVKSAELSAQRVARARAALKTNKNRIDHQVAEAEHIREHVSETMDAFKNLPKDYGKPGGS
jgi:putative FmdB family regulatory protein